MQKCQQGVRSVGSEWRGQRVLEVTDNVRRRQQGVAARGGAKGGSVSGRQVTKTRWGGQDGGERKEEFRKVQHYI